MMPDATGHDARAGRLPRRKLALFTVLLCLFFGLILSVALELVLRLVDASRPPNAPPVVTWGHPVKNNRLGFRERDFGPKPPGALRVMVLGDSLTWGAGLDMDERYSNRMERLLSAALPGRTVEVLNFGVPGGPTVLERDILRKHLDEVDPDIVVVGFCINDPQPQSQDYAEELDAYAPLFATIAKLHRLRLHTTAAFLHVRVDRLLRALHMVPEWLIALDRAYAPRSSEWRAFETALSDMREMSVAHGIPPPIFVPLLQGDGDFSHPDDYLSAVLRWTRQAAAAARKAGLSTVDLEPDFFAQGQRVRSVNPWDGHPSVECNEIYARRTAAAVAALASSTRP